MLIIQQSGLFVKQFPRASTLSRHFLAKTGLHCKQEQPDCLKLCYTIKSSAITAQMKEIDAMIGAEAESRITVQEKALADLREAREKVVAEREARLAEMKEDLAAVQSIQER